MKYISLIFLTLLLTGCSGIWGNPLYIPPADAEKNLAKIRLIGNPVGFSITQRNKKRERIDKRILPIFIPSTDIGLPKFLSSPERYTETYFETRLYASKQATIGFSMAGCRISMKFIPEANEIYEFRVSFTEKTGYCILYGTHMKYDKINDLYVEEPVVRIK